MQLDITVSPKSDGTTWTLTDLLGRSMGVVYQSGNTFIIGPEGHALETMDTMSRGPFHSLDAALAEIEKHTRGTCRFVNRRESGIIPVDKLNASNDE
ncbi:MAG TPA: hypothetical protein VG271_12660 [Beijerinckiaceae bacterium]|nr:hypothetical protein [Beijerinckiaceae bacterium]